MVRLATSRITGRRVDLLLFELDGLAQLLLQADADGLEQVDGETDPLVLLVDEREGDGDAPRPRSEDPGPSDLLQDRLGQDRRGCTEQQDARQPHSNTSLHRTPSMARSVITSSTSLIISGSRAEVGSTLVGCLWCAVTSSGGLRGDDDPGAKGSPDHLVRPGKERLGDRESQGLGGA